MKYSPTEFLKIATNTAEHFGFRTSETFKKDPLCKNCEISLPYTLTAADKKCNPEQTLLTNGVSTFCQENLYALNAPVLLYSLEQLPETDKTAFTFSIFNVQKSIAEAILIQAGRSLMQELGQADHIVRINSLGDTESSTRYSRELANFLRKRLDVMPPTARELMKEHPFLALLNLLEKEHELAYRCPNPLEYLSDQSRKHFREIVEYLDMTETPYEIDPKMIGHHEYYSDALFSIEPTQPTSDLEPSISVKGGRYDEFLYRKTRSRIPAAGAVITFSNSKQPARMPKTKSINPSVYVVQLGFGPKIRSLMVIERLKHAGIPIRHDLASDSLSTQLRDAEARGVRYTIIIGQKEFVDQTVILRDMKERNQENITIDALVKRLKRQLTPA
jgi:histidyl-tRNA synthetase